MQKCQLIEVSRVYDVITKDIIPETQLCNHNTPMHFQVRL